MSEETQPASGRMLRRGWAYTLADALKIGAAALAIPIATRLLDPSDYGIATLATTLQLLLGTLASLGLPPAILRFFYEKHHDAGTARALIASSVLVALAVTAAVAGAVLIASALGAGYTMPLLFGAALGLPTAVLAGCNSLLRAQERSTAFVSVGLFATVGAQALAIAGVIVSPVPAAYLTGALIATSAAMLVGLVLTRSIGVKPATRATLRTALAYGLPTVPYMISIFALVFADRFVIAAIDGPGAVGQYQVALAFGFLGVALVQSLQTAWLPMTFAASPGERWGMLGEISATVTRLAAFAAGFLALAAQPALSVLVPGTYDTGRLANVAAIGALATVGWATYLARTQVLLWEKRTRPLAWITPAAAALDLGLVAVLLPPFGLEGAAAATVAAVLVQTVLVGRAARGVAVVPWHLRTEAFAYGLAAACVGLALLLPGTPWGTGIQIAAMTLAGLGFLRALAAELRLIRRPAPEEPGEPGAQQPPL